MNTEYKNYIETYTEQLMSNSSHRICLIKHYNTFKITPEIVPFSTYSNTDIYYHNFWGNDMIGAYEPFLTIIKDIYLKYYHNIKFLSVYDFCEACNIYPLHYSIIASYIENGICTREEELIIGEAKYEHERFIEGIINILVKITSEHRIIVYINNINKAAASTVELLYRLYSSNITHNLLVFAAYNDLSPVLPHTIDIWEPFIDYLQNIDCVVDSIFKAQLPADNLGNFIFDSGNLPEYLITLTNLFYCLDFEQLHYYMENLYKKLELEKLSIDKQYLFKILRLYAVSSLCVGDVANALLICDSLANIYRHNNTFDIAFSYHYLQSLTQMYNGKHSKAKKCAEQCLELAIKEGHDFSIFKSKLLIAMAQMSGWHNIFFCAEDLELDEDFLLQTQTYNYRNHLAHIYYYAYENSYDLYTSISNLENNLPKFKLGLKIATELGNKQLLMEGYRKNIMLSSLHGAFDISNYFYEKQHQLVGNSDPFKEADIYKGMGYNCCATEQYQSAHDYYCKAMQIYYRLDMLDMIGEVLYNMSINCILSEDYTTAFTYLQTCLKIVNALHLNDLRVCNLAKLFGLLALCCYRLNNSYNCQMYLDYTRHFLSHVLYSDEKTTQNTNEPSYTGSDDEMFLYHYVSALLFKDAAKYDSALEYMDKAYIYVLRSEGNLFFSYVQYKLSLAELHNILGNTELADIALKDALDYCEKHDNHINIHKVMSAMSGRPYHPIKFKLILDGVTIEDINTATKQAAIRKNYEATNKQLDFLNIWQKIVDISGKTRNALIEAALNTIATNFSIDSIVYIKYRDGLPRVDFNSSSIVLDNDALDTLAEYFNTHRSGFVTSKLRKNYNEYSTVISLFGSNSICSMICIPFYIEERLDSLFINYIRMKDNWNSRTNKYMLDETDFNIFSLSYKQLVNSLYMLEKQQHIEIINHQLENAAITDYLTGMFNRDGFHANILKYIDSSTAENKPLSLSILYIDLDNFKYYNDTFGHDVGDLILKKIADLLKSAAGDEGFAVRFGGDEFLIVLKSCDQSICSSVAKNILNDIKSNNGYVSDIGTMLGRQVTIPSEKNLSASIGIASIPNVTSEDDIADALKKADTSLYKIKHTTKDGFMLAT